MRGRFASPSKWEAKYGYSRAVRVGNQIFVAGTTATDAQGRVDSSDPYEQARTIFAKIERALNEAGSRLQDVVRTRMFVTSMEHSEAVGRAHFEAFSAILPAATMVGVSELASPEILVEIEADAVCSA